MNNLFNLSEEEKNRIRGLHLTESKDLRFTSVLSEQEEPTYPLEFTTNFSTGESEITESPSADVLSNLICPGMGANIPFMTIEASVSGVGDDESNQKVMNDRVDDALELLSDAMAEGGCVGPNDRPYTVAKMNEFVKEDRKYSAIEPGAEFESTGEYAPTDITDPWWGRYQYVTITINEPSETPNYKSLAKDFYNATMEKSWDPLHPIDTWEGYDKSIVHDTLDKLRNNSQDFELFSQELEDIYEMNFYDIACDVTTVDISPEWVDKLFGTTGEYDIATEIGAIDDVINVHLKRLGQDPISKYC